MCCLKQCFLHPAECCMRTHHISHHPGPYAFNLPEGESLQQDQGSLYPVHAPDGLKSQDHPTIFLPVFNRMLPANALYVIIALPHLQETNLSLGRPSIFVTAALS